MSQYAWDITVLRYDAYGHRVVGKSPAVIHAASEDEVTEKVRAMFGATYDSFRKFWSHGWTLNSVREVTS